MSSARLAAANFGLQLREDELHVAQYDLEDRKFERLQRDVSELKDDLKEILALLQGRDPGRRTSCGRRQHSPVLRHDSSIGSPSGVQSQRTDNLPALVPRLLLGFRIDHIRAGVNALSFIQFSDALGHGVPLLLLLL